MIRIRIRKFTVDHFIAEGISAGLAFLGSSGTLRRLKRASVRVFLERECWLTVLCGGLWAASFPRAGIPGFAWVVPGLMLFAGLVATPGRAFQLGFTAGLVHYGISLYWLLLMPFPPGAVAAWVALSAYLALYPAVWLWLCARMLPRHCIARGTGGSKWDVYRTFVSARMPARALWCLFCAAGWVALEMVAARLLTGFPWNFLGVSQYSVLPVIQIASVAGVFGISFLMAWFSAALMCAGLAIVVCPQRPRAWVKDALAPLLTVVLVCGYGVGRIAQAPAGERTLKLALVQPSIPQTLIWDPAENTHRFNQLLDLSREALEEEPDLLVWPEAAVPNVLRYEPQSLAAVQELAQTHRVWMVLGADDAVPNPEEHSEREFLFYNSAFLVDPDGRLENAYRKQKLVIFGEYVPLAQWFPFLKRLTPIGEGFSSGTTPIPFNVPELGVSLSVLICFEDAFPNLARRYVNEGTDFLLNLTNNGWFGESAAQWQHAANAVFRAVENGLPLVRCANNGLTCWVDAQGRLHDALFPDSKDVYGRGVKVVEIPIVDKSATGRPTFYNRYGDWFGWSCVGVTLCAFALRLGGRPRSRVET